MNKSLSIHFLMAALAINFASAADAPKLQFDKTVYDFGLTSLVESVTGTFTYHNTGTAVLQLQKPKPSCGCTVASCNPETLKPGETGELVFKITVGTAAVTLHKEIVVTSNDPQTPVVTLGVKLATKTLFRSQPPSVSFGDLRLGNSSNTIVTIKRLDAKKMIVKKVETSNQAITATVDTGESTDPHEARLLVTATADGLPRQISEQIRVYTDDSIGAAITVFAHARFLGDIKLEPEALTWGMPDPVEDPNPEMDVILSRSFIVSATQAGQALTLRNLACTSKDVKLSIETLEKDRKYQIEASVAHRLKEPIHAKIQFETNLSSMPKVEVPLDINIWKK